MRPMAHGILGDAAGGKGYLRDKNQKEFGTYAADQPLHETVFRQWPQGCG